MAETHLQKGPQTLFKNGALGPGAMLWVLPSGDESDWKIQIDWYLNFQISKAQKYKFSEPDPEFSKFLDNYEIIVKRSKTGENIFIACENLLPCQMLTLIPIENNSLELWIQKVCETWIQLQRPSFRIFLPNNFPVIRFYEMWPEKSLNIDLTLVPSKSSVN
jgi:hypothetical protein